MTYDVDVVEDPTPLHLAQDFNPDSGAIQLTLHMVENLLFGFDAGEESDDDWTPMDDETADAGSA